VQFAQPDFAQDVRDALHHSGLAPECLELELTESVLLHNVEEPVTQMERIREMGVSIAIDDFGTGYSSLSILRRLPVNCVKIDRSFVWAAECESDGAATMIRSIVNLAHSFGLRVVAEGVQTQQQLEILRSTGADVLQGFLFHQPVPAASIGSILGDRSAAVSAVAKSLDSMHRVIAREDEKAGAQCSPGATLRST